MTKIRTDGVLDVGLGHVEEGVQGQELGRQQQYQLGVAPALQLQAAPDGALVAGVALQVVQQMLHHHADARARRQPARAQHPVQTLADLRIRVLKQPPKAFRHNRLW